MGADLSAMPRFTQRQLKKMHRKWLDDVIDVSQFSYWRRKLFASANNEVFQIDAADTTGLAGPVVRAIQRFQLRYSVRVGRASEADAWLSEGGMTVFEFWANDFPQVRRYSGNSPAVI